MLRMDRLLLLLAILVALHLGLVATETGTCEAKDGTCADSSTSADARVAKGANKMGKPPEANAACEDRDGRCPQMSRQGHCTTSPGWMVVNCAKSCGNCHLRNSSVRCDRSFLNISTQPTYQAGDMQDMFSSIQSRLGDTYGVTVLSSDPWVVTLDNFLTPAEAQTLISKAGTWERSTDTGSTNAFGETGRAVTQRRTSSNAWCNGRCSKDPHVQSVVRKIEEVVRVPATHHEMLQILRYETTQFYNEHHDMDA
jgi:hypothetical protein